MPLFSRKPLVVTHDSHFHPDDACAVAVLHMALKGEYRLERTRDPKTIEKADYVVDVGGIDDPSRQRFDHHQKGGAGSRANGVPYAAFGLVWKEYGTGLCGSEEVARSIDEKLITGSDARDNGFDIDKPLIEGVHPYEFGDYLFALNPAWNEEQDFDSRFELAVEASLQMLKRLIERTKKSHEGKKLTEAAYLAAPDKRIVILGGSYPWTDVLQSHSEPIFAISQDPNGSWKAKAVRAGKDGFEVRKPFPESWAGLNNDALAAASGVPDAVFCHNKRFLALAKSKEGALALATKALEA